MSTVWDNTIRVGHKKPAKLYAMKINEKSGTLYLKRETHPLFIKMFYLSIFMIAVVFALMSCLQYIQLQTSVIKRIRQTQALESQLFSLQNDNLLAEKDITYIHDLNYIYEVATHTLGMVPATETDIVFYQHTDREYVFQGENVPLIGLP